MEVELSRHNSENSFSWTLAPHDQIIRSFSTFAFMKGCYAETNLTSFAEESTGFKRPLMEQERVFHSSSHQKEIRRFGSSFILRPRRGRRKEPQSTKSKRNDKELTNRNPVIRHLWTEKKELKLRAHQEITSPGFPFKRNLPRLDLFFSISTFYWLPLQGKGKKVNLLYQLKPVQLFHSLTVFTVHAFQMIIKSSWRGPYEQEPWRTRTLGTNQFN